MVQPTQWIFRPWTQEGSDFLGNWGDLDDGRGQLFFLGGGRKVRLSRENPGYAYGCGHTDQLLPPANATHGYVFSRVCLYVRLFVML